jgi:NADH dehydrogenase [ubiquinone] 1 alpha subcomplex assembly factor 7
LCCATVTFVLELIAGIKASGPLTVAQYMERCNTHYYATHEPFGAQGDFVTAPEISQIFGELAGAWLADQWQQLGKPKAVLCEPGPGRGTLMKDALRATRGLPSFHDAIRLEMVETSERLRHIQQETLRDTHPRITWAESVDDLPPLPLLLIANEFFDALPVEQYVRAGLGETQRTIGHEDKSLVWVSEGAVIREASPASVSIMAQLAAHIRKCGGAALIIDYGYAGGTHQDTLQAVRKHLTADILAEPGDADLTAHVDFGALAEIARNCGACVHGPVEQGLFLKRLGAELRATALCKSAATAGQRDAILSGLERLVAPHAMGELFKVMAVTSLADKPAGF